MRELKMPAAWRWYEATPVMFDKGKCLEKALRRSLTGADNDAELDRLPELFIPGYPFVTFSFTVGSRRPPAARTGRCTTTTPCWPTARRYRLIRRARGAGRMPQHGLLRQDAVTGTLYNSNMIAPDGTAHEPPEAEAHRQQAGSMGRRFRRTTSR